MRNKTSVILLAAAIVLGGVGWWVASSRDSATEADFTAKPLFPGLTAKVNDVAGLEIATSKALFRIERGESADQWTMPSREGYPVRADLVRKNILGIAGLESIEPRTDKPEHYDLLQVSEPDQYKPADDAAKSDPGPILVRLTDARPEALASIIVGKVKSYPVGGKPGQYHVRKPSEARAWLAQGILELPADPAQWLVKDLIKVDRARVARATVTHPDGEVLTIVRAPAKPDSSGVDFTPDPMPAGLVIKSQFDVNAVAGALNWLSFDDVARADSKDFSKAVTTEIVTLDGMKVTVRSIPAEDGKKVWVTLAATFDPALAQPDAEVKPEEAKKQAEEGMARVDGWAYLINESTGRDLTRRLNDLIEPPKKEDGDKKEG
ncbi:MAG TPA: DUF4340 domain-containing protein [Ferrovibrio sp.]|jgi:hypothetical protein|uniref:DUF4340 domain-containing protein n=1 Tax=Ferrovibrio sp. TaxID=1917215 RepID=UPI002B4B0C00|nr:DUF4340 domain-containing protein [Ferrovibrio sp.]HLT76857.1 DUF4340 domain-containing protein [Ferrovibrio sp.]